PWNKGKTLSPTHRANLSAAHTGQKRSPEAVAKSAAAHRGKKRSPATRAKMSAALKGRKRSPEQIEKMRAAYRPLSPEVEARRKAAALAANLRHGHCRGGVESSLYTTWASMRTRCTFVRHKSYPNYGGRGIQVNPRWLKFENFRDDINQFLGTRPPGQTL